MKHRYPIVPSMVAFIASIVVLGLAFTGVEAWTTKTTTIVSQTTSRWCFGPRYPVTRLYDAVVDTTVTSTSTNSVTNVAEIIGSGRIGSLLAEAGNCRVLGRNDKIDPNNVGHPIYIATRNDALESIVDNCPINRRNDLVFLQNGYLDDFLASKGLLDNTQVLLYLSVPSKGATPIDGITSYNPEGLTMATGIHAAAFAHRLEVLKMKCHVVEPSVYRPAMFEKLIWICTYMLVGTAKGCQSVGQAGNDYNGLVTEVIVELMNAIEQRESVIFPEGTIPRLAAYTDVVTDFPCAVKEFQWRNQYFFQLKRSDDVNTAACPIHNELLQECETKGYLSFDLPK